MKKLFGDLKLTNKIVVISAAIIGITVGLLNSIPALFDTTITDIASYFDFWILCGILIIMNSKSRKDSALKCFLFFLISQPLIYLVEVPFKSMGWGLFGYYKFWFMITILCYPMGYIGYSLKKDNKKNLFILTPIIILLTSSLVLTIHDLKYAFPHHILNLMLIISTAIIYPLYIYKDKILKKQGLLISICCISLFSIMALCTSSDYETTIRCSSDTFYFDETYKGYLENSDLGEISLEYDKKLNTYCFNAKFYKPGKTKFIIEDRNGNKGKYNLTIGKNTYKLELPQ